MVRSALADDIETAKQSLSHDDTNVLSLPADEVNFRLAKKIITVWLETLFSNGKNTRKNWKDRIKTKFQFTSDSRYALILVNQLINNFSSSIGGSDSPLLSSW